MPSYTAGAIMISGSITPVLVTPPTQANPEDLIYTLGGNGITTTGVSGTIFGVGGINNIILDDVVPPNWYHGANSPIVLPSPTYFDFDNISISNTGIEVISPEQTRGLFEQVVEAPRNIINVTATSSTFTTIRILATTSIVARDRILVEGANIPDGIYLIYSVTTVGFYIDIVIYYNATSDPAYVSGGTIKKHTYLWDEVFTTPMGLYTIKTVAPVPPAANLEFAVIGGNSNLIDIVITDPNIVPKIGDFLVVQKIHLNTINPTTYLLSTTDGVNNIINVPSAETYVFKIENVVVNSEVYSLTLDKSFTATVSTDPKFMFILLNRKDVTYKNLYSHTWELHEVHRKQLLGDPYTYQGVALPDGRSNYLYYNGSEYLGVQNLLSNFLPEDNMPFILMHFNDNIKDRIYYDDNLFELHLPNILLQGERTPTILTNNAAYITDSYVGKYAPLTTKYHSTGTIYGYVFFDLRVVLISHGEAAMAMGYNSNRNFSLPLPVLPQVGNLQANSTKNNPLLISKITPGNLGNPTIIKTVAKHNLIDGNAITMYGVVTYPSLNTLPNTYWYIKRKTGTGFDPEYEFELYQNSLCTIPVVEIGSAILNEGYCYSNKMAYDFFLTYRLIGDNYESLPCACEIPFNFRNPTGGIDNVNGYVDVKIDFLTHLICTNGNVEGFNAEKIQLIIGMYKCSANDPTIIEGYSFIKVLTPGTPLFSGLSQNNPHEFLSLPILTVLAAPNYDIINNQPIYTGITIPDTLFTGMGEWVLGNFKWKEHAKQYRLTFDVTIPADKWNGTQNPSFETGNLFMMNKFISEIAFIINGDQSGAPQVYAKMFPVIKKSNQCDVKVKVQLDF